LLATFRLLLSTFFFLIAMTHTFKMLIDGKLVDGEGTPYDVLNPSTGAVFAQAPSCSRAQLDVAVAAARKAFPAWAATPVKERQALLAKAAAKVQEKIDVLAEVLVKEQGKPIAMAKGEFMGIIGTLKHLSSEQFEYEKVLLDNKKERVIQRRMPIGVIGGITPWNFPPLMAGWKFSEALATGNVCIIKPSPYTPLSSLLLGEVLCDVFPAGVLNILSGGDELGQWLVAHEGVQKISFTGSTRAGKAIQSAASSTLKRLTLELGGNDAAVVLDDADPKTTAEGLFQFSMGNSGQVCIAIKRAYVHKDIFDQVTGHLAELAKNAKVGDGFGKGVQFGPINNKMQFEKVSSLVEDAKKSGAKVLAGGAPLEGKGFFFPPTILTGVAEGTRIVDEEQFGPVLPVMPFSTIDEVVERANNSEYGLGASVWSTNLERAQEVANRLHAGTVWINKHSELSPNIPFGGCKESGIGKQMGSYTLEGHTEAKIVRMAKAKL